MVARVLTTHTLIFHLQFWHMAGQGCARGCRLDGSQSRIPSHRHCKLSSSMVRSHCNEAKHFSQRHEFMALSLPLAKASRNLACRENRSSSLLVRHTKCSKLRKMEHTSSPSICRALEQLTQARGRREGARRQLERPRHRVCGPGEPAH
jgi:hypothetical protein